MPLITLVGTPCSGKSYCSEYLKEYFTKRDKKVVLISDESYLQTHQRNLVFKDASKEKQMRGHLKSAVQRNLLADNLVILDSSNYIKGFRYELYCLTKEHKTTHCVFQCIAPKDVALDRNRQRDPTAQYDDEVFTALILRYEDAIPSNRWDHPLFNYVNDQLDQICDQINEALFERKAPKANASTISTVTSDNNFLQSIETQTKRVVEQIMKAQEFGQLKNIGVDDCKSKVSLNKKHTIVELNKFRRQFISFIKTHPVSTDQITNSFVQYLNANSQS